MTDNEENDENDASVPLVDGVLANEGVVDHSRDEPDPEDAEGEDAGEESAPAQAAEDPDPTFSKDVGGEA
jgi:hypothetical protein